MARGDKDKYTDKQKRKAEHIEESYEDKGVSETEAERRAWATVNKQSGGGEKGGSGNKTSESTKKSARKSSARNAAKTREKNDEGSGSKKSSRKKSSSKTESTKKSSTKSKSSGKKGSSHEQKVAAGRKGGKATARKISNKSSK